MEKALPWLVGGALVYWFFLRPTTSTTDKGSNPGGSFTGTGSNSWDFFRDVINVGGKILDTVIDGQGGGGGNNEIQK